MFVLKVLDVFAEKMRAVESCDTTPVKFADC